MREIPLTKGKVALVDDEDHEELSKYKWHAICPGNGTRKGKGFYAIRRMYIDTKTAKFVYMHQHLMGTEAMFDHVNGNGLDNQRKNLREATHSQNMCNVGKRKHNGKASSQFIGVSLNHRGKWEVSVSIHGRRVFRETFPTEIAAAIARDCQARLHQGPFARLNFPYGAG